MFDLVKLAVALYLAILALTLPDGSTDFLHEPAPATSTTTH